MNTDKNNPRLAVLIDADNTLKIINIIDELFEEVSKFGDASVRRIYGDWTDDHIKNWKPVLPKHAIQPIQQYANTKGKNATDSALIVDAMDLLYTAPLDGFCIVSSDSDFTRLAIRLRESGKTVYGFGEEKTPDSLIAACNKFIYIEILSKNKTANTTVNISSETVNSLEKVTAIETKPLKPLPAESNKPTAPGTRKSPKELAMDTKLVTLVRSAIEALSEDDSFINMGEIKKHIVKNFSAFDSRNYGYGKFSDLIQAIGLFELDDKNQHVKNKRKK